MIQDKIHFEMAFMEDFFTSHKIWFKLETIFGEDAVENLRVAKIARKWMSRTSFRTKGAIKFDGVLESKCNENLEILLAEGEQKIENFEMTCEIEESFSRKLKFPNPPTVGDIKQLKLTYSLLKTGKARFPAEEKFALVAPDEFDKIEDIIKNPPVSAVHVQIPLFGESLNFGMGKYYPSKYKIVNIEASGDNPSSPAKVHLLPEGSTEHEWRLDSHLTSKE